MLAACARQPWRTPRGPLEGEASGWIIAVAPVLGFAGAMRAASADEEVEERAISAAPGRAVARARSRALARLEGLGAIEERERTPLRLGPRTRLVFEGVRWTNEDTAERLHIDVEARGWRAAARLSRDLGFLRLGAGVSVDHVDTRFGSGSYVDAGLSLSRTVRLSRWMTAWISLSLGHAAGSARSRPSAWPDATVARLTIGTTFR